jgi:MFS family permease
MSDYTSAADRGKGLGLLESAISLGGGLGPLAGGLIADAAQLQAVIIFSLVIALVSVGSSQILLKEKPRITISDSIQSRT